MYSNQDTCPTKLYTSQVSKHPQLTDFLDHTWLTVDFKLELPLGHNWWLSQVCEKTSADKNTYWERPNNLMLQNKILSYSAAIYVQSMIYSMIKLINEWKYDFDIDERFVDWGSKLIKYLSTFINKPESHG